MPLLRRLAFFGSPDFAVPALAALVASGRTPELVVTQPPRPAGRGRRPAAPPVAVWANAHGLRVVQPERVRDAGFLAQLAALAPDLAVVVAFGQIFPAALLCLPRAGCINLHASLLPRHRGASPIQAAIVAGDTVTGVTVMRMVEGLDSGPILLQRELPIREDDTAGELAARLAAAGAELLVAAIAALERGEVVARGQDEAVATYAPRLTRADGRVDFRRPAAEIAARVRAFTPWPGAVARLRHEEIKLLAARPLPGAAPAGTPAGAVLGLAGGRLVVACGASTLLGVERLQRPGRRPLAAEEFARGARLGAVGGRFD